MKKIYKNIFDFDMTTMRSDAEQFQIGKISEELVARIENISDQLSAIKEKATTSRVFSSVKMILNLIWCCIFVGLMRSYGNNPSWKEIYEAVPGLFHVGIGAFLLWIFLLVWEIYKKRKAYKEVDIKKVNYQIEEIEQEVHMEMGIPEGAGVVDVLYQNYEMKEGKKRVVLQPSKTTIFMENTEMFIWKKEDSIFVCDRWRLYKIPMERFGEFELIKKVPMQVSSWNKEEPINHKKFKKFKLYKNNGRIFVKQHYRIYITNMEEESVILIPNYDIATVQELLGREI